MYEKSYEKEITVYQYECDVKNRMTAAALLKQVQQISTEHCDIFGLDAAYYQLSHLFSPLLRYFRSIQRIPACLKNGF